MRDSRIKYKIIRIDETRKDDIRLPNEPFPLWGRMIPTYDGNEWDYRIEEFNDDEVGEMVFPDENYEFNLRSKDSFFVGAYDEDGECVGLAVYKREWHKYLYLEDLKVVKSHRGQGVGKLLLDEGMKIATENGYRGIHTIGQDNNLSACLFYIRSGFVIGGLDTHVYKGTGQEGKNNIHFYFEE